MSNRIQENSLKFQHLTEEEKKAKGILGVLYGPVASIVKSTRNGRRYSDKLWEKVFKDPIVEEYFNNGGLPLELDHPEDRDETCSEKIAAMMPYKPEKDNNGHLVARIDIIDTPMGRIANTLARYGFQLGISSRGNGEVITDYNGNEDVDPDTYELKAWDLVLLPAVEDARLKLVENLNQNNSLDEFKKSLNEELDRSSDEEKKMMKETLRDLDIDYNLVTTTSKKEVENINESNEEDTAVDNGVNLSEDLQQMILNNQQLSEKLCSLQEQLSICYTKEADLNKKIDKYKSTISSLVESTKKMTILQKQNKDLQQSNDELNKTNKQLYEKLKNSQRQIYSLNKTNGAIEENLINLEKAKKEQEVTNDRHCDKLMEDYNLQIKNMQQEHDWNIKAYKSKVDKLYKLNETYKKSLMEAFDSYIALRAMYLGVDEVEIRNKLNKGFNIQDIDRVCESLSQQNINISKLPFNIENIKNSKISIKEAKQTNIPSFRKNLDNSDDIDNELLSLVSSI